MTTQKVILCSQPLPQSSRKISDCRFNLLLPLMLWQQWRMRMQPLVAPLYYMTFLLFKPSFFQHYSWNIYGEQSRCFGLCEVDVENSPIQHDRLDHPREEESRNKPMRIQLGLKLLLANVWSQEKEVTKIGLRPVSQIELLHSKADCVHGRQSAGLHWDEERWNLCLWWSPYY